MWQPLNDNELINKAYLFSEEKHKGQTYGKYPFIYHPLQVYEIITAIKPADVNLRVASLLHDTIESGVKKNEIETQFSPDVLSLVQEVTKTDYNTFPQLKTQRGVLLKFADRLANLANMKDWSQARVASYIEKSKFWKP